MIIPNFREPLPDELASSWLYGLAGMNGLGWHAFSAAYLGKDSLAPLRPDPVKEYGHIREMGEKAGKLFLTSSTYPFEAIFMSRGQQARFTNHVFYPPDTLNLNTWPLFKSARICPECRAEDIKVYRTPYLHASHHLSGVKACPRHGCLLWEFKGRKGDEFRLDPGDYAKIDAPLPPLSAYAEYAYALLTSFNGGNTCTDLDAAMKAVYARMAALGYTPYDSFQGFICDFRSGRHSELFPWDDAALISTIRPAAGKTHAMPERLLPVIMSLFPDPDMFVKAAGKPGSLISSYICPDCGKTYYASPASQELGWGCPECSMSITEEDRFRRLMDSAGHGEYEPAGPIITAGKKMPVIHKTCGRKIYVKPDDLLFGGVRCICEKKDAGGRIKEAVEAMPDFDFIRSTGNTVTVRHEPCGSINSYKYSQFLDFPVCPVCSPPRMTEKDFKNRVKALAGDNYTVTGCSSGRQMAVIRHEACGHAQAYDIPAFLSGSRCGICAYKDTWEKHFKLMEEYIEEFGTAQITESTKYKGCNLGRWCLTQRRAKAAGTLSEYREERLKEIGFKFDIFESRWNEHFDAYQRYVRQYGSTFVPEDTVFEGENLGYWYHAQKKRRKQEKLSQHREVRLLAIDPKMFG